MTRASARRTHVACAAAAAPWLATGASERHPTRCCLEKKSEGRGDVNCHARLRHTRSRTVSVTSAGIASAHSSIVLSNTTPRSREPGALLAARQRPARMTPDLLCMYGAQLRKSLRSTERAVCRGGAESSSAEERGVDRHENALSPAPQGSFRGVRREATALSAELEHRNSHSASRQQLLPLSLGQRTRRAVRKQTITRQRRPDQRARARLRRSGERREWQAERRLQADEILNEPSHPPEAAAQRKSKAYR